MSISTARRSSSWSSATITARYCSPISTTRWKATGILREALIEFGTALATVVTSDVVIRAQRVVIGVAERMPSMSRDFYERGPRRGQAMMRALIEKHVAAGTLDIDDTELATYQLADLFMSGMFKKRLFGCMATAPIARTYQKDRDLRCRCIPEGIPALKSRFCPWVQAAPQVAQSPRISIVVFDCLKPLLLVHSRTRPVITSSENSET